MYPDPVPFDSAEEFARAVHADLPELSIAELHRELALARLRAAADDEPSIWLGERLGNIEAALAQHDKARR